MKRKVVYPFTAIVGQEEMKLSLILQALPAKDKPAVIITAGSFFDGNHFVVPFYFSNPFHVTFHSPYAYFSSRFR